MLYSRHSNCPTKQNYIQIALFIDKTDWKLYTTANCLKAKNIQFAKYYKHDQPNPSNKKLLYFPKSSKWMLPNQNIWCGMLRKLFMNSSWFSHGENKNNLFAGDMLSFFTTQFIRNSVHFSLNF